LKRETLGHREDRNAMQNLRGCNLRDRLGMNPICKRVSVFDRLSGLGQYLLGISREQKARNEGLLCTVR
jgi:hypothetical protein